MENLEKVTLSLLLGTFILFSLAGVSAQQQTKYMASENYSEAKLEQINNQFQKRYAFNCSGECLFKEENNQLQFEVKEQRKFLFFNIETKETYDLGDDGEILRMRNNFWSKLLNRNKISFNQ